MPFIKVCSIDEEGRFGGPERRVIIVGKALKQHGIDTHVVYPIHDSEKFSQKLSKSGLESTSLDITRLTEEKKVLFRYSYAFLPDILRLYFFFRKLRNPKSPVILCNIPYQNIFPS